LKRDNWRSWDWKFENRNWKLETGNARKHGR
jgi:hypothetical protein